MRTILTLAIAATLLGCATPGSPGRNLTSACDPCKAGEAIGEVGKANLSAAEGGFKQELAPVQGDKVPVKPHFAYGAGAGDTDASDSSVNRRRQVTSGNQYNGLFNYLPVASRAGDGSSGGSPLMVGLSQALRKCHGDMAAAMGKGDEKAYKMFTDRESSILDRMESASSAAAQGDNRTVFNLPNAKSQNLAMAKSHADGEGKSAEAAKAEMQGFAAGAVEARKSWEASAAEYASDEIPPPPAAPSADAPETPGTGSGGGD